MERVSSNTNSINAIFLQC